MEDTLSNQDLDASHTIIGTDSEATAASGPRRDFRAVAACGGLASLAVAVIGVGILIQAANCIGRTEFCPADRPALRHMPYRLSGTYPVWAAVQTRRLYDGGRPDH